jgi:Tol biopolymer transport system component
VGEPAPYVTFALSPDEQRVAVAKVEGGGAQSKIWIIDLVRNLASQATFGTALHFDPRWSPDGRRLVFTVRRTGGTMAIFEQGATGAESLIVDAKDAGVIADDWSHDGDFVLYHNTDTRELGAIELVGERKRRLLVRGSSSWPDQARFSPDGKWVAFDMADSGRPQVYVIPFPATGQRWQISSDGGVQPLWRGDGRELFYLGLDGTLFAVTVATQRTFEPGIARPIFKTPLSASADIEQYAVTRDGQRFLILKPVKTVPEPPTLLLNWRASLKSTR